MVEFNPIHPLGNSFELKNAGVSIEAKPLMFAAQLFASKGKSSSLTKMLNIKPTAGKASVTTNFTALPLAPDQWMLVAGRESKTTSASLAKKIKGQGHVSEQSDSRIKFTVSGPKARELMSRGCRLDLHPDVTGKGFCAQTPMAQVGVLLHQVDDGPTYDLYVYSGFAHSFWHWLTETALQFDDQTSSN